MPTYEVDFSNGLRVEIAYDNPPDPDAQVFLIVFQRLLALKRSTPDLANITLSKPGLYYLLSISNGSTWTQEIDNTGLTFDTGGTHWKDSQVADIDALRDALVVLASVVYVTSFQAVWT